MSFGKSFLVIFKLYKLASSNNFWLSVIKCKFSKPQPTSFLNAAPDLEIKIKGKPLGKLDIEDHIKSSATVAPACL